MKKFLLLVCIICVVICSGKVVHAQISINEIMYDLDGTDTDHEWVEIYNNGGDAVDLTDWKFGDGSNHGINIPPANGGQGSIVVGGGEYIILSPNAPIFLSDHSGYSGTVLDTVMSLTNTTDTISIIDKDGAVVDSVTYSSDQGGAGDGNSLSLTNGSWSGTIPSPGGENSNVSNNNADSSDTSESSADDEIKVIETPKITADITLHTPIFSGITTHFEPNVIGYAGEDRVYGKFEWSMGDGFGRIDQTKTSFDYIYEYPGDYVVTLAYYSNMYSSVPEATHSTTIKVIEPTVLISQVYDDGAIEIKNTAQTTIDLSQWKLQSGSLVFVFPSQLSILSNHTIRLSSKITGFTSINAKNSELLNPSGIVVSKSYTENTPKNTYVKGSVSYIKNAEDIPTADNPINTALENQEASSVDAETSWLDTKILYLISIILVGVVLIFIVRRKNDTQISALQTKDGYEIIE